MSGQPQQGGARADHDNADVAAFQRYLRVMTVHPTPALDECVEFLREEAQRLNLPTPEVLHMPSGLPVVLIRVEGSEPQLPALLLNSHVDVVPVDEAKWSKPAWHGAVVELDGQERVYGRGSQDMKCVGMQHMIAVSRLLAAGTSLRRTVVLAFMPDEEVGGHHGMVPFLASAAFKDLRVGLALDEGLASPCNQYSVYYGERMPMWLKVTSTGPAGHGSRFVQDSAMEKLVRVLHQAMEYRRAQESKMQQSKCLLGDVTSVNLTGLHGGVTNDGGKSFSVNVVPTEAAAWFDFRITPHDDEAQVTAMLDRWTSETGVSYEFVQFDPPNAATDLSSNPRFWSVFQQAVAEHGVAIQTEVFPAATDSRYIRKLGIPALGFSPIRNTPILLHDHDEYLPVDVYTEGIDVFVTVIERLANADAWV